MPKAKTRPARVRSGRSDLARRVLSYLRRYEMVKAGDRVAVGCSGGADSTSLLLLLEELRELLGIQLAVLHFNHHLRGTDSDEDERFVLSLADSHGLECCVDGADVAAEARKSRANVEDTARRLRYAFFQRIVAEGRATRVAVAHTIDDQAETVLAHLLRGTGPTGLGGIHPVVGTVIRPLLEIRRNELREYLRARKQSWREDKSNVDIGRTRARIRQVLVPLLEAEFQPATVEHLTRLAEFAREDERFWQALVEGRHGALVEISGCERRIAVGDLLAPLPLGGGEPAVAGWLGCQEALAKRLVRRIVSEIKRPGGQLGAGHVEQVLRLARTGRSGDRLDLPGGLRAERELDRLLFHVEDSRKDRRKAVTRRAGAGEYEYEVRLDARGGAKVRVVELGRSVCLKVIDWPPAAGETRKRSEVLDRPLLRAPLVLRNWRPGDSYRPLGRMGARKLRRLLLEKRVSQRARVGWPVLTSREQIVWVQGLPVAAEYAAREETRSAVVITEESL